MNFSNRFLLILSVIVLVIGPLPLYAHGEETHDQPGATGGETTSNVEDDTSYSSPVESPGTGSHHMNRLNGNDHHGLESGSHVHDRADHHSPKETVQSGQDEHHDEQEEAKSWLLPLLPGLAGAPNIHPLLVHFPITLLWTSLFFVCLSWFWQPQPFLRVSRWLFWLGLIALPVTAATGFLAVGGWGGGHVIPHRNFMLLTTVLAFGLFGVLRFVSDRTRIYRIILTVGLIIVVLFMTLGADRGAWLVFVEGSGVKPAQHLHEH